MIEDRMNVNYIELTYILVQPSCKWSRVFEAVSPLNRKEIGRDTLVQLFFREAIDIRETMPGSYYRNLKPARTERSTHWKDRLCRTS
jgi:hypothetical protein